MAVEKRGVCTFVAKARGLERGGGDAGLLVNSEDALVEMPAGKEPTAECKAPVGIVREGDGEDGVIKIDLMRMRPWHINLQYCVSTDSGCLCFYFQCPGSLLLHAAARSEVLAIIEEPEGQSVGTGTDSQAEADRSPCGQVKSAAAFILERWAHSVPHAPATHVLQTVPPSKVSEECSQSNQAAMPST
jgi:hypothetical protein